MSVTNWLTPLEAKDLARVSKSMIYKWVKHRCFPVHRPGAPGKRGKILIDRDAFLAFLDTQKVEAGEQVEDGGGLTYLR